MNLEGQRQHSAAHRGGAKIRETPHSEHDAAENKPEPVNVQSLVYACAGGHDSAETWRNGEDMTFKRTGCARVGTLPHQ